MLDVHEQQLLVLLLVVQPELDQAQHGRRQRPAQQVLDRLVDGVAVGGHLPDPRPAQQPPLGPGVAGADALVVRVPQVQVALVDGPVARAGDGISTNCSKNQVTWARCHLVGLTSGIDCTVWSSGDSGAASASVARPHGPVVLDVGFRRAGRPGRRRRRGAGERGRRGRGRPLGQGHREITARIGPPAHRHESGRFELGGDAVPAELGADLGADLLAVGELDARGRGRPRRPSAGPGTAGPC